MSDETSALDALREETAVGRGVARCKVCGDPSHGRIQVAIHEYMRGNAKNGVRTAPAQRMVISRSLTLCDTHLVESWRKVEAVMYT